MQRIAFLGALDTAVQKMALHLHAAGHTVTFAHVEAPDNTALPILVLSQSAAPTKLAVAEALRRPWLAWNRSDRPALAAAAYQAGALAVLPARLSPAAFQQAVQRLTPQYAGNKDVVLVVGVVLYVILRGILLLGWLVAGWWGWWWSRSWA